nr:squalene synthase [Tanacetum cinerariifolium]
MQLGLDMAVQQLYDHMHEIPVGRIKDIEAGQRGLEVDLLISKREMANMIGMIGVLERDTMRLRGMLCVERESRLIAFVSICPILGRSSVTFIEIVTRVVLVFQSQLTTYNLKKKKLSKAKPNFFQLAMASQSASTTPGAGSSNSNLTLKNHISHPHCEALKRVSESGQSSMSRDGSIFVYNSDVLREQFAGLVIQRGLPFNHFDDGQTTRVFQKHLQPKYNH